MFAAAFEAGNFFWAPELEHILGHQLEESSMELLSLGRIAAIGCLDQDPVLGEILLGPWRSTSARIVQTRHLCRLRRCLLVPLLVLRRKDLLPRAPRTRLLVLLRPRRALGYRYRVQMHF